MALTFDTLKFVQTLESAGIDREQASAFAAAVRDSQDLADLVTKKDLEIALAPVRKDIDLVRKDIDLLRWMLGAVLGGIIALVLKAFF